ncbi:aminotransferase class I/II-fold pyridoxal phosphate-dependent enzyme [Allosalinactinospora lopnorensis]|uniref:aminotransferase class I/II-fold pyridoxal phosphate-dependent enzyme n=1 Tax=Allosalinactinospora lopnorensis TaxID=1352348 RepID=UPI000AB58A56|nr:aminotransferase class I/II-fold pyridoxal phosphate-dependent enzyme [Allosalinactinospora lopnorensis]
MPCHPERATPRAATPIPRLLPDLTAALSAVAARRDGRHPMYGEPPVTAETADVAREIFAADAVPAESMTITSGALDGIDRVLRSYLRPGDSIALEDPGWPSEYALAATLGLKRIPLGLDGAGPLPGDLAAALRSGARAVILTNRAQNPTGAAFGSERAARLRSVLSGYPNVLTVEDDYGFGFADAPFHSVRGATERWTVIRSVAKSHGPDLRLAMLAGDVVTVDRVRAQQQSGPGWVSRVLQETFVELQRRGQVSPERVGRRYAERRGALVSELARHGTTAHGRSGMNVWVPVTDEAGTVTRLLARGWATTPGARFRMSSGPGIRVTVSALTVDDMPPLASDIAEAVRPAAPNV